MYDSLEQRVFFKKVTLVIPSEWRDSMCQTIVRSPQGGTPYQVGSLLHFCLRWSRTHFLLLFQNWEGGGFCLHPDTGYPKRKGNSEQISNQTYQKADISIGGRDVVHGVKPFTKQSRSCGHPGDGMSMPYQFLTSWNRTWSSFGDPAKLFVKEWVKLR